MSHMAGELSSTAAIIEARLADAVEENGDREFYMPCLVERDAKGYTAKVLRWRGSADIFTLQRPTVSSFARTSAPRLDALSPVNVVYGGDLPIKRFEVKWAFGN